MKSSLKTLSLGTIIVSLIVAQVALASPKEMTAEEYLKDARPYLHHSCVSAYEAAGDDEERLLKIVQRLAAVSFYNNKFDGKQVQALPKEKQETLRVEFEKELGRLCEKNNNALLAGVIDTSLVNAMAKVIPSKG